MHVHAHLARSANPPTLKLQAVYRPLAAASEHIENAAGQLGSYYNVIREDTRKLERAEQFFDRGRSCVPSGATLSSPLDILDALATCSPAPSPAEQPPLTSEQLAPPIPPSTPLAASLPPVGLPSFVGLLLEDAVRSIEEFGLTADPQPVESEEPTGTVLAQHSKRARRSRPAPS